MTNTLIRFAYRAAQRLRLIYWKLVKPRTYGVKVIAFNPAGDVLLVRHSYHQSDAWLFPGGGIKRSESAEGAAARELSEETGCTATSMRLLGVYENRGEGARNQISAFVAEVAGSIAIDEREILEARFFPPEDLPEEAGPATRRRIAEWQGRQAVSPDW